MDKTTEVRYAFREEGIGLGELLATGGAELSVGVLAEDPLAVDPESIKDIDILLTVMNGRVTHMTTGIYVDKLHKDKNINQGKEGE